MIFDFPLKQLDNLTLYHSLKPLILLNRICSILCSLRPQEQVVARQHQQQKPIIPFILNFFLTPSTTWRRPCLCRNTRRPSGSPSSTCSCLVHTLYLAIIVTIKRCLPHEGVNLDRVDSLIAVPVETLKGSEGLEVAMAGDESLSLPLYLELQVGHGLEELSQTVLGF